MEVGRAELGTIVLSGWCVWFKMEAVDNFWKFEILLNVLLLNGNHLKLKCWATLDMVPEAL